MGGGGCGKGVCVKIKKKKKSFSFHAGTQSLALDPVRLGYLISVIFSAVRRHVAVTQWRDVTLPSLSGVASCCRHSVVWHHVAVTRWCGIVTNPLSSVFDCE